MIEDADKNNWIDRDRVIMESLTSIRRAGAGIILTYHAKERIGVFSNLASSSALRIAATRPSIMSDGAITSTPARASETEVFDSSSKVSSLTISYSVPAIGGLATAAPSGRGEELFTTPQCP